MAERIVVNTGPLIALARADVLDVVARLPLEFWSPGEVREELDAGIEAGHPAVDAPWLRVVPLRGPVHPIAAATLDAGEAAVIQLALESGIGCACIDDWRGRRTALAVGLRVTGSLGLLIRARQSGLLPSLRPVLERLQRDGAWFDDRLVQRVLDSVGE